MSVSPSEVRIEHSVDDQAALGRSFTVMYAALAGAGLLFAVLIEQELLLGAAFFAGYVLWWARRMRREQAEAVPWIVHLTPTWVHHAAAGTDVRVERADAASLRVKRRPGPRMLLYVLEVRGRDGSALLRVSLPGPDEASTIEATAAQWGWPARR